ncbi:MAG: hypothetical protein OQK04_04690, partial [Kangiellaceae bacterium]|nr:hypothetical protein [Kangiellaceae bacterium]
MSHPLEFARQKTDSIIKNNFTGLFMNNTKWVKLIKALSDSDLVLECKVKLVWDESLRDFRIRFSGYCHDFYDTSMEGMISGFPRGFYEYKEIQWIEFPIQAEIIANPDNFKAGTKVVHQDIYAIRKTISKLGKFELEESDSCLRLYG